MNIQNPSHLALTKIYDLFENWANDFDFACAKGCSTCCTRNVTMTTLEGELILDYIKKSKPDLLPLLLKLPQDCPSPGTTTNQFASACFAGKELEGDTAWDLSPCLFLRENSCTIYPVRSFMCRSFGSSVRCDESGEAVVDPLFLTLNTVILQCIEHMDQGRPWGNMNSILRSLVTEKDTEIIPHDQSVLSAEPIPGLLIPPDESDKLEDKVETLLGILKGMKK